MVYDTDVHALEHNSSLTLSFATLNPGEALNSVQNTALRICTGAFRTKPAESLQSEANVVVCLRRQRFLLSYIAAVSANKNKPVFPLIKPCRRTENYPTRYPSIPQILSPYLHNVDILTTTPLQVSSTTPWMKTIPKICTCIDSMVSVQSFKNIHFRHPLVQAIHESFNTLASQDVSLTLFWIPSHKGIQGNDLADHAVKEAAIEKLQIANNLKNLLVQNVL
ncbi:hypothetical protein HHI36_003801 [Cryptolaemus montrouzieri]|uniref:RNase H type-1 domain-containing protein n=1 Tax=Cryptolaemus montrouzieri TaxID=559131 RepID=A0ABD2NPC4_9CUCU